MPVPDVASLEVRAVLLSVIAMALMLGARVKLSPTPGLVTLAGVAIILAELT